MRIVWLNKALQNLDAEIDYIASSDPQSAQLVLQRIQHSVSLLSSNPNLGHSGRLANIPELVIPKTRYIIPYRVKPRLKRIEILRVFHTSRKPPERW